MVFRTMAAALVLLGAGVSADEATSRSFTFSYEATVGAIPASAESGTLWIPIPQSNEYQTIENVAVNGSDAFQLVQENEYGNQFAAIDLSPGSDAQTYTLTFDVTRQVRRNLAGDMSAVVQALQDSDKYLRPNALVTTDGIVAEEALRVAGNVNDPLGRARALYDHIVSTVRYDKSGEGWGRGDTIYACDTRAGNCTDFHSLFIGEARSLEIPSRFLMGFPVPLDSEGEIGGYHCWAEFYIEGRGWVPIDASEAFKDPSRKEELFGGLDQNRVQFTIGRDITLPGMQGAPLNYSIYPYAEVDGAQFDDIARHFTYRDH